MEGIAKAKAVGVYKGRPASIQPRSSSSKLGAWDRHRLPSSSALLAHPFIGLWKPSEFNAVQELLEGLGVTGATPSSFEERLR
jgi:hypothetical protein